MAKSFLNTISNELAEIEREGLYKRERTIVSAQSARVAVNAAGEVTKDVINLCANNYLGLANDARLTTAARDAMFTHGFGMASVRFICGTQDLHRELERELAAFLNKDDAILFGSCFDANGGLFEPLLGPDDAVVSDSLNHASIIDGIRLSKARRYRYANNDMDDLEEQLRDARSNAARNVMIATDGVFSMDGHFANLAEITELARKYDAVVMVDDCHATGFVGNKGMGTPSHFGVDVDILTGTLGKALGGAMGGYVAGPKPVVDILRQRSRPYLFSNALPPAVVAAGLEALRIVRDADALRAQLFSNACHWRTGLEKLGFNLLGGEHPIVPVMLGDARVSQQMSARLFELGVYVTGFFYPVVPKGRARIRTQVSAGLSREDLNACLEAFAVAGREAGAIQ